MKHEARGMKHEARGMKHEFMLCLVFLASCFLFLSSYAQEPIQLGTETEDIALTDDINIARAQVKKYPDNPEAHFNLAIALSRTSAVEDAIKELRKTKLLIRKEENAGIIEKKIIEYKEILKGDPAAHNIRYRLAFSHYLKAYLANKTTTSSMFGSKLALDEKNSIAKENLELSIYYFNELLKLNPNDSWAKIYLGFILAEQFSDTDRAKELWHEVLKTDPNNPASYFFLGELHIKEGKLKEGIKEISQAILLRSLGY